MTSPLDPPLVRERAAIRAVRSRATFQIVFGLAFVVFAVVAGLKGAGGWTVAIAAVAGVLFAASGVVAAIIAHRRLSTFEGEHGAGAGSPVRRRPAIGAESDAGDGVSSDQD